MLEGEKKWRNDTGNNESVSINEVDIVASDEVGKAGMLTALVQHVRHFGGHGFMPTIKSLGESSVNGKILSIDQYEETAKLARKLLEEKLSDLNKKIKSSHPKI